MTMSFTYTKTPYFFTPLLLFGDNENINNEWVVFTASLKFLNIILILISSITLSYESPKHSSLIALRAKINVIVSTILAKTWLNALLLLSRAQSQCQMYQWKQEFVSLNLFCCHVLQVHPQCSRAQTVTGSLCTAHSCLGPAC